MVYLHPEVVLTSLGSEESGMDCPAVETCFVVKSILRIIFFVRKVFCVSDQRQKGPPRPLSI